MSEQLKTEDVKKSRLVFWVLYLKPLFIYVFAGFFIVFSVMPRVIGLFSTFNPGPFSWYDIFVNMAVAFAISMYYFCRAKKLLEKKGIKFSKFQDMPLEEKWLTFDRLGISHNSFELR